MNRQLKLCISWHLQAPATEMFKVKNNFSLELNNKVNRPSKIGLENFNINLWTILDYYL